MSALRRRFLREDRHTRSIISAATIPVGRDDRCRSLTHHRARDARIARFATLTLGALALALPGCSLAHADAPTSEAGPPPTAEPGCYRTSVGFGGLGLRPPRRPPRVEVVVLDAFSPGVLGNPDRTLLMDEERRELLGFVAARLERDEGLVLASTTVRDALLARWYAGRERDDGPACAVAPRLSEVAFASEYGIAWVDFDCDTEGRCALDVVWNAASGDGHLRAPLRGGGGSVADWRAAVEALSDPAGASSDSEGSPGLAAESRGVPHHRPEVVFEVAARTPTLPARRLRTSLTRAVSRLAPCREILPHTRRDAPLSVVLEVGPRGRVDRAEALRVPGPRGVALRCVADALVGVRVASPARGVRRANVHVHFGATPYASRRARYGGFYQDHGVRVWSTVGGALFLDENVEHAIAACHARHGSGEERVTVAHRVSMSVDESGQVEAARTLGAGERGPLEICLERAIARARFRCGSARQGVALVCAFPDAEVSDRPR